MVLPASANADFGTVVAPGCHRFLLRNRHLRQQDAGRTATPIWQPWPFLLPRSVCWLRLVCGSGPPAHLHFLISGNARPSKGSVCHAPLAAPPHTSLSAAPAPPTMTITPSTPVAPRVRLEQERLCDCFHYGLPIPRQDPDVSAKPVRRQSDLSDAGTKYLEKPADRPSHAAVLTSDSPAPAINASGSLPRSSASLAEMMLSHSVSSSQSCPGGEVDRQ